MGSLIWFCGGLRGFFVSYGVVVLGLGFSVCLWLVGLGFFSHLRERLVNKLEVCRSLFF